jgi:hypothetical protein
MFLRRTTLDERRNLGRRDSGQVTWSTVRRKRLNAELATSYGHGVRQPVEVVCSRSRAANISPDLSCESEIKDASRGNRRASPAPRSTASSSSPLADDCR